MQKEVNKFFIKTMVERILSLIFFLMGSKFLFTNGAIVYFFIYFIVGFISYYLVYKINNKTLSFKMENNKYDNKILRIAIWIIQYLVIYFVIGNGVKSLNEINMLYLLGLLIYFFSVSIYFSSLIYRAYVSSEKELFIKYGPYKKVRFPKNISTIIELVGIAIMFKSSYVIIVSLLAVLFIILNTFIEDRNMKEIKDYDKYCKEVKYRLIPYIW